MKNSARHFGVRDGHPALPGRRRFRYCGVRRLIAAFLHRGLPRFCSVARTSFRNKGLKSVLRTINAPLECGAGTRRCRVPAPHSKTATTMQAWCPCRTPNCRFEKRRQASALQGGDGAEIPCLRPRFPVRLPGFSRLVRPLAIPFPYGSFIRYSLPALTGAFPDPIPRCAGGHRMKSTAVNIRRSGGRDSSHAAGRGARRVRGHGP